MQQRIKYYNRKWIT